LLLPGGWVNNPKRFITNGLDLRVLISAYACEPEKGSEPAVGWIWVHQIARFHEAWVITRANNREAIECALAKEPLPNVHWLYFDLPRWARFWKRKQRGIHLYYHLWQMAIFFVARKLHRRTAFDVVHHITLGQYWVPSFLALLPIPFIWGPVGGGESAPLKFWWDFSNRGKVYEVFRSIARSLASFNPIMRICAKRSRVAIATTEESALRLRKLGAKHVTVHPQFGMTNKEMQYFANFSIRRCKPFRLISMGRLIHWKGFHLSLRAFAKFQAKYPDSEYWIVSSGPEGDHLKALAKQLGIEKRVVFWGGFRTLQEVYASLQQCDVLVHPALHEAFGNVCLEAMAAGRPVVCVDLGGPAVQVTTETGVKVPAAGPEQVVGDLAEAFSRLAGDPDLRVRFGRAAQRRAKLDFNWDTKGEWMNRVYHSSKNAYAVLYQPEDAPLLNHKSDSKATIGPAEFS
jgi:glycosyltransferase involved in cell wall biosynthesis